MGILTIILSILFIPLLSLILIYAIKANSSDTDEQKQKNVAISITIAFVTFVIFTSVFVYNQFLDFLHSI